MKKIRALLSRFDLNDVSVLAGAGLFTWGVWLIYPPAAMIILGTGLISWGWAGARIKVR